MRVLILSRKRTLYTTRRLVEEVQALGHQAIVADPLNCGMACGGDAPLVFDRAGQRRWRDLAVAIPRIGASASKHGLAVVRNLEDMGIPVVNSASSIAIARDKLRSLQLLAAAGLPIPRTALVRTEAQVPMALRIVGGPPVVVKLLQGSQGVGVMLAETQEAVTALLGTMGSLGQPALVQEFVSDSRGEDLRVLVVDGRVTAAMRRTAQGADFRSNLHRGGTGRTVRLSPEHERVAVRAAALAGLDVAGVDLLDSRSGPKVVELNSSPGFEGLERATGRNVARAIVAHAVDRARSRRARGAAVLGVAAGAPEGPYVY